MKPYSIQTKQYKRLIFFSSYLKFIFLVQIFKFKVHCCILEMGVHFCVDYNCFRADGRHLDIAQS